MGIRHRLRTRGWLAPVISGFLLFARWAYAAIDLWGNADFVSTQRPWRWLDYIFNPWTAVALLVAGFVWLAWETGTLRRIWHGTDTTTVNNQQPLQAADIAVLDAKWLAALGVQSARGAIEQAERQHAEESTPLYRGVYWDQVAYSPRPLCPDDKHHKRRLQFWDSSKGGGIRFTRELRHDDMVGYGNRGYLRCPGYGDDEPHFVYVTWEISFGAIQDEVIERSR